MESELSWPSWLLKALSADSRGLHTGPSEAHVRFSQTFWHWLQWQLILTVSLTGLQETEIGWSKGGGGDWSGYLMWDDPPTLPSPSSAGFIDHVAASFLHWEQNPGPSGFPVDRRPGTLQESSRPSELHSDSWGIQLCDSKSYRTLGFSGVNTVIVGLPKCTMHINLINPHLIHTHSGSSAPLEKPNTAL